MTLSSLSIYVVFWILTLKSLSLYVVFLDPHQGISRFYLFLPTVKAFVEFIGRETALSILGMHIL
jgi:hypothetical protein